MEEATTIKGMMEYITYICGIIQKLLSHPLSVCAVHPEDYQKQRGLSVICVFALTRLNIYIELVKHWVTVSEEIAEATLIQTIEESAASSIYGIWFLTSIFSLCTKKGRKAFKRQL